jgi:hypothetical protein
MADGVCTLEQALGRLEPCPGPACSFWHAERGEECCVLEGVERELLARPTVAEHLLVLRRDMDEAARLHAALTSGRPRQPNGRGSIFERETSHEL